MPSLIEEFRAMMEDKDLHIAIAKISELHLAQDGSALKVSCEIFPEEREIVAQMTWECVGPESGFFCFPCVEDLVLIAFTKKEEQAFVIKRLTSSIDTIPESAKTGDSVLKALAGKGLWLTSDKRINLSKGDSAPSENLVLGSTFKGVYGDHIGHLIDVIDKLNLQIDADVVHIHTVVGIPTTPPSNAAAMTAIKVQLVAIKAALTTLKLVNVTGELILSHNAYTE